LFDASSDRSLLDTKTLESQVLAVLDEIIAIGGIENVILASREGFPMFSRQTKKMDDEGELLVAAMLSGLMATVEGATSRLGRSVSELVTVESADGYIVICDTFDGAVLAVTTTKASKLGLVHYIVRQAEKRLESLLAMDQGQGVESFHDGLLYQPSSTTPP
jgi:predicted regulator of Ras-like GTPase activity (Roadblock/LC7/MglB family)